MIVAGAEAHAGDDHLPFVAARRSSGAGRVFEGGFIAATRRDNRAR
jgi:hypothetical protein